MDQTNKANKERHFVIVFTGSGYAADAMAHLVSALESRGHHVELVSYGGLAAQTAKSIAARGFRGLRAAARTVTGRLTGEDPLGLVSDARQDVDAVIATGPDLVSATRALAGGHTLRLGLMADLDWDPAWADVDADALLVPHPVFRELLVRREWPEAAVLVAGVPLPEAFSRSLDIAEIRGGLGLKPENGTIVLVDAEDVDEVRLERLVFQLSLLDGPTQPIFHVGEDERAAVVLRRAATEYGVPARMFGVVDNLQDYYAASDVVLSEVVNPRIYALLALDKPVLLIDANAETKPVAAFLHDEGAAVIIPDILRLGAELDGILHSPDELARLRDGAGRVVDQQGVAKLVAAIESAVDNREELKARPAVLAPEPAPQAAPGPFEVIGTDAPAASPSATSSAPSDQARPPGPRELSSGARVFERHRQTRLTRAEAKEELAALILMERDVEKRLGEATGFVGQWERRLDLARRAGEQDLAHDAERFLGNYRREESGLLQELDRLRVQKDKLKRRVAPSGRGPAPADPLDTERIVQLEQRFRSMELEGELDRLKGRLDDQYGDD